MAERDKIFPGDTLPVEYEMRKPDPDSPNDAHGLPANARNAYVRLMDETGTFIPLGAAGALSAPAEITPATGTTRNDTGSIIRYVLGDTFTQTPGRYTLYTTAEFADGSRLTEDRKFTILEMR